MDIELDMLEKCAKANAWIEQAIKDFCKTHDNYIKG